MRAHRILGGTLVLWFSCTAVVLAGSDTPPEWLPQAAEWPLPVLMLVIGFSTYLSEDAASITAGFLVAAGTIDFIPAVISCLLGITSGDLLLFTAGHYLGKSAIRYPPLSWILRKEDLERGSAWFASKGPLAIVLSRFIPGSRLPTYVAAGALGMNIWLFAACLVAACLVWTPFLVGLAAYVGARALDYLAAYSAWAFLLFIAVLFFSVVTSKVIFPLFSWRGRRLLLSRWRRMIRWEFWPAWVFYVPLVLPLLRLGLKHRNLTAFTAVNPAIPAGGFIGESKSAILDLFVKHPEALATYRMLPAGQTLEERLQALSEFQEQHSQEYPLVIKPDAGQRGTGVHIVRDGEQAREVLNSTLPIDMLLQVYIPGREYGVFYIRHPDENAGEIFALTDKHMPPLLGDGIHTLEHLVFADDRTVCMASFFLHQHAHRLYEIPEAGERIQLVELGTHCLGAVFREGEHLITPELNSFFDRLCADQDGFYFGRFDVRAPDDDAFMRGQGIQIIELNGVTSEATSIYEPGRPLREAYRTLAKQWEQAFRIGSINIERGARCWSLSELLKMCRDYRKSHRR